MDNLDKKAETSILSPQEVDLKQYLKNRLAEMLRQEEIKWYQQAKVKELLEGDSNTKYFQLIANGKHRKTRIYKLQDGNHIISGDEELKNYITTYYKGLFGPPDNNNFNLDETRIEDIPQVTDTENEILTSEFTEAEVREAIFQMEHNKAPGPDGFPAEFYQAFWDTIKVDLMALFQSSIREIYLSTASTLGQFFYYQSVKKLSKFSNTDPSVCFMLALKFSQKWLLIGLSVAQKVISPT